MKHLLMRFVFTKKLSFYLPEPGNVAQKYTQ